MDKAKLLIEKADDAIKEFGNTNQERKVQLRKWKAQAELVLPPSTIDDLRKRAEGELLKRSYPRNPVLRKLLLAGVALTVIVLGALVIKQQLVKQDNTPSTEYSAQMPSPVASPTGLTNSVMPNTTVQKPEPTVLSSSELRTACIQKETSKTFFNDTVTVGIGGVSFEGSPLRHFVDVVVSSPGYRSAKYSHQQNGDKITYRGMGVFEITVASTDTFEACFSIRRFHEKSAEEKSVP